MKMILSYILPDLIYKVIRDVVRYVRVGRSYLYDLNHYVKYSMAVSEDTDNKLVAKIILDTHVIEKGLTMPKFRLGFGQARLLVLLANVSNYLSKYNKENSQLLHALSVIDEYFAVHNENRYMLSDNTLKAKEVFLQKNDMAALNFKRRHQKSVSKAEYFDPVNASFFKFSDSRSSVRNYSEEPVCIEDIKEALNICRNTPSACNRQSVRIHLFTNKDEIKRILDTQGGNRGFGHLAGFLIIVTYEPSMYFEESERNSGIVDGGMYCMNILYALHSKKMVACILNAAHSRAKDIAMRKVANIPKSEVFVAMIAGGHPAEEFKIATSFRYPLESILEIH